MLKAGGVLPRCGCHPLGGPGAQLSGSQTAPQTASGHGGKSGDANTQCPLLYARACCTGTKAAQQATSASSSGSSGSSIQPPPAIPAAVVPTVAQGRGSPSNVKLYGRRKAKGTLTAQAMVEWPLPGCKDHLVRFIVFRVLGFR
jgi:hypothetical protein